MKLAEKDIEIKGEGQQLRAAILSSFESIEEFSKKIPGIKIDTINNYLRKAVISSDKFKFFTVRAFERSYNGDLIKNTEQQIKVMVDSIANNIILYDKPTDINSLNKLKDLCVQFKMPVEEARMFQIIGLYYLKQKENHMSIDFFQSAINLFKNHGIGHRLLSCYSDLARPYFYDGDYRKVKQIFKEALVYTEEKFNTEKKVIFNYFYQCGMLYNNINEHSEARAYFEKALLLTDNEIEKGKTIMNIGISYKREGSCEESLKYYFLSLEAFNNNNEWQRIVYNNIAELYKIIEKYTDSQIYLDKAFMLLNKDDIETYFLYTQTKTELLILSGDKENAIIEAEKIFAIINNEASKIRKDYIITGIKSIILVGSTLTDKFILTKLSKTVVQLIRMSYTDEYRQELNICHSTIILILDEIEGGSVI